MKDLYGCNGCEETFTIIMNSKLIRPMFCPNCGDEDIFSLDEVKSK